MLFASSHWRFGESGIDTRFVVGQHSRLHVIRRWGLVFDARFCVGPPPRGNKSSVYFLLSGHFTTSKGQASEPPGMWLLKEEEFESASRDATTFRSWGAPAVVADICLHPDHVLPPIGIEHGKRTVPPGCAEALLTLLEPELDESAGRVAFATLLRLLAEAGVLHRECADEDQEEPPHMLRLWEALSKLYSNQDTGLTMDMLSLATKLSPRQLYRDTDLLIQRIRVAPKMRASVRVMRLRRATLLLSAPEMAVGDVARAVGYGSADAMARAFRDAKLPSPSEVRASLFA